MDPHAGLKDEPPILTWSHLRGLFTFNRRAWDLVWTTSHWLAIWLTLLTLLAGLLPGLVAYISKLLVDSVVQASTAHAGPEATYRYLGLEAASVIAVAAVGRATTVVQSLLRAQLGQRVNVMILEKALTLNLRHFEDSEFYDKMSQARRQASHRPLSLVMNCFDLARSVITLATYGVLLLSFSGWAVLILILTALPTFFVEAKYSGDAFRLFRWRSPDARMQMYLESLLAREDNAKEVKLFGLGPLFLERYQGIFHKLYGEDRDLTLKRGFWSFVLGLLSTAAFYGAYVWIVVETVAGRITLGEMTMYLMIFKQGQSAVAMALGSVSAMYEHNLYISNLYEFLEQPVDEHPGKAVDGPQPGDGVRFENVSFTYDGGTKPALANVTLHLKPGEKLALVGENGSGKTTLVKLLSGLYTPTEGRILLDGRDLREWNADTLRARIGVIFQDFVRYQLLVGENVGVGDVTHIDDEPDWEAAARKGLAHEFIEGLPSGYKTQLGRWFKGGRELSGGQWQKVALSRAFMRAGADILVLDEPTSAVDPKAEVQLFEHFREATQEQMAILISHRFSTVRRADHIAVLEGGRIIEEGSHEALLEMDGQYAHLFRLQAAGYK